MMCRRAKLSDGFCSEVSACELAAQKVLQHTCKKKGFEKRNQDVVTASYLQAESFKTPWLFEITDKQ